MCVMPVVGAAPCQCFSPGANHTTSPGRISSTRAAFALHPAKAGRDDERLSKRMGVPRRPRTRFECHAGPLTTRGIGRLKSGSIRTLPVNHSAGPFADGCEPARLISIFVLLVLLLLCPVVLCPNNGVSSRQNDLRSIRLPLREYLSTEQCLDRPPLVHRAIALRHLIERQGQVEHLAGIDLLVPAPGRSAPAGSAAPEPGPREGGRGRRTAAGPSSSTPCGTPT